MTDAYNEYRQTCARAGLPAEDIENTAKLFKSIDDVLENRDIDPYMAPDLIVPQKARLARLFINLLTVEVKANDETIAKWIRENDPLPPLELACRIAEGAHWEWWARTKRKERP